jgi:hypothetical protein
MKVFFKPNISRNGRIIRAVISILLLLAGIFAADVHWVVRIGMVVVGVFVAFEAQRGWCALRACGIKTRL